eukprot:Seg351.7 transcript_id=Seg351.7/GoldUCD/mRNA.D3Y31 product="Membrane-associated tyrosine- and threonine-specific cdc2-inhibitory kinase" protein_id=Seg351.7/GoldUCD/D3Y31
MSSRSVSASSGADRPNSRPTFKTPRPVPVISSDQSFSHKKKGITRYSPPKPPAKSAPPISRVFRYTRKSTSGPQAVSFRERNSSIESPHYNADLHVSYFEQCFKVLNKVGAGSFGEVFKVQSKEDGKLYAVKKSRVRFKGDFDRKQKLEEVHKHEHIQDSRNCVKFYRAWEEKQFLFIQTELCEMSLKDYAEKVNEIEEDDVWNMIVDLTMGLKHLHNNDFAHMDIKPANLFLGRDGYYKIGDFGLALDISKPTDVSEAQEGDPKYMAPELMQGKFTKAADIFSLGITILELACNMELPRGGELWQDLREEKLPLGFTQGLSQPLLTLIRKMMATDLTKRPTVDDILGERKIMKVLRRRKRFWFVSKLQSINSILTSFFLQIFHFLTMLILLPKSMFLKAPSTPKPDARLPPSDLDSTFPHSSDSSLSFDGHESLFNNSSDENIWHLPSPRKKIYSDSTLLKTNIFRTSLTPEVKQALILESSPEHGSISNPDISLTSSPHFSPVFNPRASPRHSGTPISEKLPRTRLFVDDVLKIDAAPKNLLTTFNDASDDEM